MIRQKTWQTMPIELLFFLTKYICSTNQACKILNKDSVFNLVPVKTMEVMVNSCLRNKKLALYFLALSFLLSTQQTCDDVIQDQIFVSVKHQILRFLPIVHFKYTGKYLDVLISIDTYFIFM